MKVLVLGAGGPAGVNTCRALREAGFQVFANDDNPTHLEWTGLRSTSGPVDVVVPQPDSLVRSVAAQPEPKPHTFLPSVAVIDRCQQKEVAVGTWSDVALRSDCVTIEEPIPDHLHIAAGRFGFPFWLRANRGAGANKAVKITDLRQAYHWIRFWETRGEQVEWIAEEFFPGRDLAWTSIWYEGALVACFLRERLEYLYPHLSPEGLTGTPTIARIVHDQNVTENALEAVRAIADRPHGIFSVDLREDVGGVARPTEINAGRGFTTMGLWSLAGWNFTALAAWCAIEEPVEEWIDPFPAGLTLMRHIDCPTLWSWQREPVEAAA